MALDSLVSRILVQANVFYKHQQHDEPDLTAAEKESILRSLYDSNPYLFLQRYENYISKDDSSLFDAEKYENGLILKRINDREGNHALVRNRRYLRAMKMKADGTFFSDFHMREREPYLFDVMVGRYLEDNGKSILRPSVERPTGEWSHLISQFEDSEEIAQRRNCQQAYYEASSSGADNTKSRFMAHVENVMDKDEDEDEGANLDEIKEEIERISREEAEVLGSQFEDSPELLREEFDAYMLERFLAGKDSRFVDYKEIDGAEADEIDAIKERDDEERWFDED